MKITVPIYITPAVFNVPFLYHIKAFLCFQYTLSKKYNELYYCGFNIHYSDDYAQFIKIYL